MREIVIIADHLCLAKDFPLKHVLCPYRNMACTSLCALLQSDDGEPEFASCGNNTIGIIEDWYESEEVYIDCLKHQKKSIKEYFNIMENQNE